MIDKTRPEKVSGSIVKRVADQLRDDILSREDGDYIGSLPDLLARYKISAPTFRQAARMMEQEQLMTIKRGVGGGFFARLPSASVVAHTAAVFLSSRRVTLADAVVTAKPLYCEIARAAARRCDADTNAAFSRYEAARKTSDLTDIRTFLRSEREFQLIFSRSSGNAILELYTTVLLDFASNFVSSHVITAKPGRVHSYLGIRSSLIQAILSGDEELAGLMAARRSNAIIGWMEQDSHAPPSKKRRGAAGKNKRPETIASKVLIGPNGAWEKSEP